MKKIDMLAWMFNHLTMDQLATLKNMALAMIERPEPVQVNKRPPLND